MRIPLENREWPNLRKSLHRCQHTVMGLFWVRVGSHAQTAVFIIWNQEEPSGEDKKVQAEVGALPPQVQMLRVAREASKDRPIVLQRTITVSKHGPLGT